MSASIDRRLEMARDALIEQHREGFMDVDDLNSILGRMDLPLLSTLVRRRVSITFYVGGEEAEELSEWAVRHAAQSRFESFLEEMEEDESFVALRDPECLVEFGPIHEGVLPS